MEEMGEMMAGAMGGGETAKEHSGWTVDTLHAHLNRLIHETDRRYQERFVAQELAVREALKAAQLAVDKAELNAQRWRDNANEWRDAMNDRETNFVSQAESNARLIGIDKQIADLKKSRDSTEGRVGGVSASWGYLIGFIGLIGAIISILATR